MKINYPKKIVRISNTYHCSCGHKFYRKLTDWYTMSPLNPNDEATTRKNISDELMKKTKPCPKCKNEVTPIDKVKK